MAQQRTLKELAVPNLDQQPLCIQYPPLDVNFELKSGLIHLLPSFHGLPGEDPNKHLKEFHIVCSSMKPAAVTEEQIKLRAFPFSLKDAAKEWLYYLPPGTVETWNGMKTMFLERYFPASKVGSIRKEICGIRQYTGESLYEYWERFKRFCASCPHHQISEQLLIQYFNEGLQSLDRSMIDAVSGGALVDKTPAAARTLISNMAANSQQFGIRQDPIPPPKLANEVRPCGICQVVGHPTDTCPTLVEGETEGVNAVGNFPGQLRQMYYEPFSQTYNPGWRDHPNLRYGNQQQIAPQPTSARPPGFTLQQRSQNNYQTTQASIKSLENQVGQLAASYNRLEAHLSNKLPSQPEMNPKENASAVTLRSGTQYDPPSPPMPSKLSSKPQVDCSVNEDVPPEPTTPTQLSPKPTFVIPPPFPSRLKKTKKEEKWWTTEQQTAEDTIKALTEEVKQSKEYLEKAAKLVEKHKTAPQTNHDEAVKLEKDLIESRKKSNKLEERNNKNANFDSLPEQIKQEELEKCAARLPEENNPSTSPKISLATDINGEDETGPTVD
ncbi:uncharacterized protein LOC133792231 [Humulus lupulus]|uniref:uncharacterized protein LOC133792231 n=1 Tax=Humulus lupulus TaxID=3486 RepID=UPI002B409C83|nr:uncharacterized protein LOC133792231 [Humulus lupulus]